MRLENVARWLRRREAGWLGARAGPRGPEPYARAAALLFYSGDSPYSRIPQALKYKGDIAAGRFFAGMLGRLMAEQPHWQDVDAVIPVPLHWRRKHARGYNQAEVIAAELAKALGARLYPHALRRVRRTRSQTSLSAADRLKNVSGVFELSSVRKIGRDESSNKLIVARHVVLVDDTFTTGATLAACRQVLREALGQDVLISVATLAAVSK